MTPDPFNPYDLNGQQFAAWMAALASLEGFDPPKGEKGRDNGVVSSDVDQLSLANLRTTNAGRAA